MANSAFRLVDDDFDFEDLDEIDDMDLNKLVNPEDGSMGFKSYHPHQKEH